MSSSRPLGERQLLALGCLVALAWIGAVACASTDIDVTSEYSGALPRPDRILIFPFATSPEEVQLDWSPTVSGAWKLSGTSPSEERQKVAHEVANALAKRLVTKVQALGLPAELATEPVPPTSGRTLAVSGQFIAIDEGNRAERLTIGLGAGHSTVRTSVQVAEIFPEGRRLIDQFEVDAKSGRKPGAAETMGAGAVGGHLVASAAVTAAGSVASEAFGDDVEADAERTAKKVASALQSLFVRQGWIPPQGS
jgi:hypothetical protein